MGTPAGRTLIVGVGNARRGDDGAGLAVARRVRAALHGKGGGLPVLESVAIVESDGEGTALLGTWQDDDTVFIVDAAVSGDRPGKIHRIDMSRGPAALPWSRHSTHAFGVAEGVALAAALGRLPRRLIVYGIEAEGFPHEEGLSASVTAAVEELARTLVEEVTGSASTPDPEADR